MKQPVVSNNIIKNSAPSKFSKIEIDYDYYHSEYYPENISLRTIDWYISGKKINYLSNLTSWNDINDEFDVIYSVNNISKPTTEQLQGGSISNYLAKNDISILNAGDSIYYIISVSNGSLSSDKIKSNEVKINESVPFIENFFLKGLDSKGNVINRIASDTDIIISPNISTIFHSDSGVNKSIIKWFVGDSLFKSGVYGDIDPNGIKVTEMRINELGKEVFKGYGIRILNGIFVQIIPKTETTTGVMVQSPGIVIQNSIPVVSNLVFTNSVFSSNKDIESSWDWFNYESIALADLDDTEQFDQTTIEYYRKNIGKEFELIYSANLDTNEVLQETFNDNDKNFYKGKITVDFVKHTSTILSSALNSGQKYYIVLKPFDGIDNGVSITSKTITITNS